MRTRKLPCRTGQTLILLLLMLFAIFGVLALTVDLGFVFLSRRSMQAAVNTGALEGGRFVEEQSRITGEETRINARILIRNVFDDDLDPTSNSTSLGAGLSQGIVTNDSDGQTLLGTGNGTGALLSNRSDYVYRPTPELNLSNAVHGDLVVGDYSADAISHVETSQYLREDFLPAANGNAFLARLRRTPMREGVANPLDRVSGTSSSGQGSPILLGRLLPFLRQPSGFDLRQDGIAVRATSIAYLQPIVHVGDTDSDNVYQTMPYVISLQDDSIYTINTKAFNLGEQVTLGEALNNKDPLPTGYLPIVDGFQGNHYVVAFSLRLKSGADQVKHQNGSPHLHHAAETLNNLPEDVRQFVLQRHTSISNESSLRVHKRPVLVRSVN